MSQEQRIERFKSYRRQGLDDESALEALEEYLIRQGHGWRVVALAGDRHEVLAVLERAPADDTRGKERP